MLIVSLLLAVALIYLAVRYPPAMACAFMLCAFGETSGIGGNLRTLPISSVFGPLCFISTLVAFAKIWRERRDDVFSRRVSLLALIALFGSLWAALAAFSVGSNLRDIGTTLFGTGMFGMVIALAYRRVRYAQALFVVLLLLQLGLSVLIITLPGGVFGQMNAGLFVSALDSGGSAAGDMVGITEQGIARVSAQFANPVQLAFYGVVALIVGWYLLTARSWGTRAAAGVLLLLGGWATLHTIERGILIGLGTALLPAYLRSPLPLRTRLVKLFTLCAVIVCEGVATMALFPNDIRLPEPLTLVVAFFGRLGDSSEYDYRITALLGSIELIFTHPLFGVGTFEQLMRAQGLLPHQAMVFWSVTYGLPAGICCTLLLWFGMAATFASRRRLYAHLPYRQTALCLLLGWVVCAMALTNNMSAGMFGWVCLAIAALAWVHAIPHAVTTSLMKERIPSCASSTWA